MVLGILIQFLNRFLTVPLFDCCIISVPDHLHFHFASICQEYKIPFLIVKPLVLSESEARHLASNSYKYNIPSFVEFHKRFDRSSRFIKDSFLSGELGSVLYSFTEYCQPKSLPLSTFKSWSSNTNIFSYLAVHYVDLFYYITGYKPSKVSASGQMNYLAREGVNTYDSIQANIEWISPSGFSCNQIILCNWIQSSNYPCISKQSFQMVFDQGRVDAVQDNRGLSIVSDNSKYEFINPDFSRRYCHGPSIKFEGYGIDSVVSFLEYVSEPSLRSPFMCDLHDAIISTSVIEAVNQSLSNNSDWISLPIT